MLHLTTRSTSCRALVTSTVTSTVVAVVTVVVVAVTTTASTSSTTSVGAFKSAGFFPLGGHCK